MIFVWLGIGLWVGIGSIGTMLLIYRDEDKLTLGDIITSLTLGSAVGIAYVFAEVAERADTITLVRKKK